MSDPKHGSGRRELLEAWRNEPLEESPRNIADADRHIQQVAIALRGVAARRRRRAQFSRIAAGLAVAAAIAGIFVATRRAGDVDHAAERMAPAAQRTEPAEPGAQRTEQAEHAARVVLSNGTLRLTSASGATLPENAPLGAGTELETAEGAAEIVFSSGSRTLISKRAALSIAEAGAAGREAIRVARGRVDVEVPEGVASRVFSVRTPNAVVVVHGTRFSVDVDPRSPRAPTRVAVTRGVVTVTSGDEEVRLTAGQEWPDDGASAAPEPTAPRRAVKHRASPKRAAREAPDPPPRGDSSLPEENRWFAVAMTKKKDGELASALSDVEAFIVRYPDSVLLQEARVERFRLLHRLGRAREAARRAREYLGDYRDGYARDEAREIALEQP